MLQFGASLPYCGSAPLTGELWARWNLDPVLLVALLILLLCRGYFTGPRGKFPFWTGWAVLCVAFVSPLCALSSGLFSARSVHHLLLVTAAAPLLAHAGLRLKGVPLSGALVLHVLLFWGWHLPVAYEAALSSYAVYWLMQLTLLGSALAFWGALYDEEAGVPALTATAIMVGQMGLLGALLTFAPEALYGPHLATTGLYGLTPLEDQQLAGLLMWVASLPLAVLAALPAVRRHLLRAASRMTAA